jgi:hypothetical protein
MNIPLNKNELILTYTKEAVNGVLLYNISKKSVTELPLGLVDIFGAAISRVSDTQFAVIGGTNHLKSNSSKAVAVLRFRRHTSLLPKPSHFLEPMATI